MPVEIPSLPGLLSVEDVRRTATAIARTQEPDGAVPWFRGGHTDPWDHVECAMALLVAGEVEAAERAYDWLFRTPAKSALTTVGDDVSVPELQLPAAYGEIELRARMPCQPTGITSGVEAAGEPL